MSVDCELEVSHREQCGIDAFERCAECQRAFCRSHQTWQRTPNGTGLVVPIENWCTECQARHKNRLRIAWQRIKNVNARPRLCLCICDEDGS